MLVEGDLFELAADDAFRNLADRLAEPCRRLEKASGLPVDSLFVTFKSLKNDAAVIRLGINEPSSPFGVVNKRLADGAQGFLRLEKATTKRDAGSVWVCLDAKTHQRITPPADAGVTEKDDAIRVCLPLAHADLIAYIEKILIEKIGGYRSANQLEYGCCHLYKDCSSAGQCVHPNRLFASACVYRRNLAQGKIYWKTATLST